MHKTFLKIKKLLNQNKIILTQSDTIPALICKLDSLLAIEEIFKIKNRPKEKPFAIFVNEIKMLQKLIILTDLEKFLLKKYCPGYFTFLINLKQKKTNNLLNQNIINLITSVKNDKRIIGIRIPKDNEILKFIDILNTPLIATSANISKEKSPSNLQETDLLIKKEVDFIWNRNTNLNSIDNSTIIDISEIEILEKEILKNYINIFLNQQEKYKIFEININIIKAFLQSKIVRIGSGII